MRACRHLLTLCGLLLVLPVSAAPPAKSAGGPAAPVRVAIIIDDLGNHRALGYEAVALPGPLTYSILPSRPFRNGSCQVRA